MHTLLTIRKFKVKEMIRSACSYLFYSVVFTEKFRHPLSRFNLDGPLCDVELTLNLRKC